MSPGEEAPGPGEGVRRRKLPGCPLANIQEIGVPVFLAPPRKGHPVDMIRPSARSRGGPEAGCSPLRSDHGVAAACSSLVHVIAS